MMSEVLGVVMVYEVLILTICNTAIISFVIILRVPPDIHALVPCHRSSSVSCSHTYCIPVHLPDCRQILYFFSKEGDQVHAFSIKRLLRAGAVRISKNTVHTSTSRIRTLRSPACVERREGRRRIRHGKREKICKSERPANLPVWRRQQIHGGARVQTHPAALALPPPEALYHSAAPDPPPALLPRTPSSRAARIVCAIQGVRVNLLLFRPSESPPACTLMFLVFWRWVPGSAFSRSSSRGCWPGLYKLFRHFYSFVTPGGRQGEVVAAELSPSKCNVVLFGPRDADAHFFSAGTFFPLTFSTTPVEVNLHFSRIFELLSLFFSLLYRSMRAEQQISFFDDPYFDLHHAHARRVFIVDAFNFILITTLVKGNQPAARVVCPRGCWGGPNKDLFPACTFAAVLIESAKFEGGDVGPTSVDMGCCCHYYL